MWGQQVIFVVAIALAGLPLAWAAWANRRTTLLHALAWAAAAWMAWILAAAMTMVVWRYAALCLTGCAGVAVLGARRPGAAAWNAVVLGLLAVLLLPLGRQIFSNAGLQIDPILLGFLAVALAVSLINYIPTRGGIGAVAMLISCLILLHRIDAELGDLERILAFGLTAAAPWFAAIPIVFRRRGYDADARWLDFRDRFGVVWAARLREQFNRAAENSQLKVELGWRSLRRLDSLPLSEGDRSANEELLAALMQRFGLG